MFRSPFDDLDKRPVETVEGNMSCSECYAIATEGFYDRKARRLTYTCPNGHVNVGENFDLE